MNADELLRRADAVAVLERAADPAAVRIATQRLLEAGADIEPHLAGWLCLIDASPAGVDTVIARPALARDIPRDDGVYQRQLFESTLDEDLARLPSMAARIDHLRQVRVEETLRIAWQDVVAQSDITVVTRRISDLADILMQRLLAEVHAKLSQKYGRPWHGSEPSAIAVIAMGKLGGAELNYSSDIDLIFLYDNDGDTDGGENRRSISNREFFHRLTERVTREANAVTERGRLYRVDLRLRPEGAVGSLARTLASSIKYYQQMGETWERQAHLKARVIAGDRRLGESFVQAVKDWAYGRGLSYEEISAIKRLKQRMESITETRGEEHTEVKQGYGGIRDVEYVIQFLQLLHGSRVPEVRHHNSLTALRLLEGTKAILPEERDILDDAYRFLRVVEHRIMLVRHAQSHRMPDDPKELTALARRCRFETSDEFMSAYRERADAVRGIFNRLFRKIFTERSVAQANETNLLLSETTDLAALARVYEEHGLRDINRATFLIEELTKEQSKWLAGSPRTRQFLASVFPALLDALARTPDPDAALRRFERITSRVGARATLYQAIDADPRLLKMLIDLAGHSRFLCRILERAPGTLDQLVDALATEDDQDGLASFEDIPTDMIPSAVDPARILSDYRNLEMLRIGLRDVRGKQDIVETGEDLTRLAQVIVRLAYERARNPDTELVILALGKLGTGELTYGSDLDLVYFARDVRAKEKDTRVARRFTKLLDTPNEYGLLYDIDLRLRPGGKGGPLVTTPAEFENYFRLGMGQTWERMAYSRARAVAGSPTLSEEVEERIARAIFEPGFTPEHAREMEEMRAKIAAKGGPTSIKRAQAGGLVDIEFVTQMYALSLGKDEPRFRDGHVAHRLTLLQELGAIDPQRVADLQFSYRFLLTMESKLRLGQDLSAEKLPEDPDARRALARRLGYRAGPLMTAEASFDEEYQYHRDIAARAFREAIAEFTS